MKKILYLILNIFLLYSTPSCAPKSPSIDACISEKQATPLPSRIKLNVVYIPMDDNKSCATTSAAMAISYYENRNNIPLDKEAVWKLSGTDENTIYTYGNDMKGLKNIAHHYGYRSKYLENMNISTIEHFLQKGTLVIVNVGSEIGNSTHALLIVGYDKNRKLFYINDPACRRNKILEYSYLESIWSAWLSSPRGLSHRSGFIIYPKNHKS